MAQQIIIEFSGWIKCDLSKVRFEYAGEDDAFCDETIDGNEYLALSEDKREEWVPESMIDALQDADDSDWCDIEVVVEYPSDTLT